jgi:hypothetical protein
MQEEYLRVLTAHLHTLLIWTIAAQHFGKSYLALEQEQMNKVEDAAYRMTVHYYRAYTPDLIKDLAKSMPSTEQIQ